MIPDQAFRGYPGLATTSTTMAFYFRFRANKDAGTYNVAAGVPDLTIVFPNGRNDAVTLEAIREAVITHLLNNNIQDSWTPPSGAPESVLRTALSSVYPHMGATGVTVGVLFNGQFGPVMVG